MRVWVWCGKTQPTVYPCSTLFGADHLSLISATAIKTAIQGDLGRISNFPLQIWILLRKLVQVQIEQSHMQQITYPQFQPLLLKQPGWSGENLKFPSSDLDSPWKTSPGTSQTIPFGECCPTSPGAPIIVLGVAGVIGWIKQICGQIHYLCETWV